MEKRKKNPSLVATALGIRTRAKQKWTEALAMETHRIKRTLEIKLKHLNGGVFS